MSALEKMREAFDSCTVMAGVEPDFECVYITKDVADALLNEAEAENAKLRELCTDIWNDALRFEGFWDYVHDDGTIYREDELPHYQERMRECGIEVK